VVIQKINIWRGKVYLLFDNGEKLQFAKPVFEDARLKVGDEINCEQKENLININEIFLIKTSALRMLARREHSSKELNDKLKTRGYSAGNIKKVVAELVELNLLSDERFAEIYVRSRFNYKKKSPKAIYYDLLKKGVDKTLIENELDSLDEEDVFANARELAAKKLKSLKARNSTDIPAKLRSHLTYKAYSTRIINRIIEEVRKEINNAEF